MPKLRSLVRGLAHASLLARLSSASLLACLLATNACEVSPAEDDSGSVEVIGSVQSALSQSDVTRVAVTISFPDGTTQTSLLAKVNGQWRGIIGKIPAGPDRTFVAEAFDAAGVVVYRGETTGVLITKNVTGIVAITLQQTAAPVPFDNAAPIIDSLVASSNAVAPSDLVSLSASAHDPNASDALTYSWEATGGTFEPSATTLATGWRVPAAPGVYSATLKVADAKGAVAATTFSVDVKESNGKGGADVRTTLNTWPTVAGIVPTPTRIDVQESTALALTAADADGDPLTFAWSSSCAGTFSDPGARNPSFTLLARPANDSCPLDVVVTDGRGGRNTGRIVIQTGPGAQANVAPVLDETFQSTDTIDDVGQSVILRVRAHDPEGTALTFDWSATGGVLGTPSTANGTSEITWTSAACLASGAPISITAEVRDATGVSTTDTFTVTPSENAVCSAGFWRFDNDPVGQCLDSSPNGRHGTVNAATAKVAGRFGSAYAFNGGSSQVVLPLNVGMDDFTVSFWVQATESIVLYPERSSGSDGTSGEHYAYGSGGASGNDASVMISVGTNGVAVFEHGGGYVPAVAVHSAAIGTGWNHVAVTYTSKVPRLYINGVLSRTGQASPKDHVLAYASGGWNEFDIAKVGGGVWGRFAGVIDEVRVRTYPASAAELAKEGNP